MHEVEASAARGDTDATLAIDVYVHRLAAGIASMCAATGGLDVLVFTGGVGENSALVRRRAADRLGFLAVRIDAQRDGAHDADRDISAGETCPRTIVVAAGEDLQILREVRSMFPAAQPIAPAP